jgi:hypothetical protein
MGSRSWWKVERRIGSPHSPPAAGRGADSPAHSISPPNAAPARVAAREGRDDPVAHTAAIMPRGQEERMRGSRAPARWAVDSAGFPYPPYLWLVVRQSALLWALARMLVALVLLKATGDLSVALHPGLSTRVFVVVVTSLLVWWDRRRTHELLLHAVLGASPGWFWIASLLTACVMEAAVPLLIP